MMLTTRGQPANTPAPIPRLISVTRVPQWTQPLCRVLSEPPIRSPFARLSVTQTFPAGLRPFRGTGGLAWSRRRAAPRPEWQHENCLTRKNRIERATANGVSIIGGALPTHARTTVTADDMSRLLEAGLA